MAKQGAQMPKGYQELVDSVSPKPTLIKNVLWAFIVGGLICLMGQLLQNYFMDSLGMEKKEAAQAVVIAVIFMGAFLTGLGVYDEIGKRAGAGSIVPISGFANSIVAPAMEFRREGLVFGVGAKMFVIAGPVIVYGITTAVVIGLIYWLTGGQGG
ncbi:MAG: stage V sporulation protein AC [Selenomonadales bacterium]|nr:stage V sporulation protein AC [Selenomonadales bacterium]